MVTSRSKIFEVDINVIFWIYIYIYIINMYKYNIYIYFESGVSPEGMFAKGVFLN